MSGLAAHYDAYRKVDVETASQGKLIVMLFNGAIQRAEEAKRQLDKGKVEGVHNNLIRAQDIIAELRTALDMSIGEISHNLDRVYEYIQHLLISANIRKEVGPIDECLELMTTMRDAWQELFEGLDKEEAPEAPKPNPHGASVFNVKG